MQWKTAAAMVLVSGALAAPAQMGGGAAGSGAKVAPAQAMNTLIDILQGDVVPAAKAMPADKYDFAPSASNVAGAKFEEVRTFAGQVKHLAQANYFFFGTSAGLKPDVDVKAIADLKTKDEIVAALERSFAFAHKAAGMLTVANSFEPVEVDGHQTRITGESFGVAHAFDHYGQMVEYLRLNGIVPPASQK